MTAATLLLTLDGEGPLPGRLRPPSQTEDRPAQVDVERFVAWARRHADAPTHERLIVVGDGAALEQHGFRVVEVARASGFERIQLVTSPRRLTDARLVRAVIQAGVDGFSVGLHGADEDTHDRLTGQPGGFATTMRCLRQLAKFEVRARVDVVVSRPNLDQLEPLIDRAAELGVDHVGLWTPTHGGPELLVDHPALLPALRRAIATGDAATISTSLHRVPACLLGELAGRLDNSLPDAFDGVRPGRPLPESNCLWEARCEAAEACGGLTHAHVNAYGWGGDRLVPIPRARPWRPRERSVEQAIGDGHGPRGHAAWLALLGAHATVVEGVALTRIEARYPLSMPDGTRFVLVITARDPTARTFKHSRSFNLAYTDVDGPATERAIAAFVEPILDAIIANDDGALSLDAKDI